MPMSSPRGAGMSAAAARSWLGWLARRPRWCCCWKHGRQKGSCAAWVGTWQGHGATLHVSHSTAASWSSHSMHATITAHREPRHAIEQQP